MLALDTVHIGDARELAAQLDPQSVNTIVTSPPYFGLRSYLATDHPDKAREMGGEATPDEFVAELVGLFAALRPALRDDGTLWLNLGDSYANNPSTTAIPRAEQGNGTGAFQIPPEKHNQARRQEANRLTSLKQAGLKHKDLIGIPWSVALALRADGWILRSDIIWHKPNPMPESVTDRPTRSHEYLFLLSKSPRYHYDAAAIAEPCIAGDRGSTYTNGKTGTVHATRGQGPRTDKKAASGLRTYAGFNERWDATPTETRNKRDVWTVPTQPYPDAHFATFPPDLIRPCIRAGCPVGGVVLDPFVGSGTTAMVAVEEGRRWLGFDLDERAVGWTAARLQALPVRSLFAGVGA